MKNTSIFASAAMILATAAIASANPFSDVPASHWAYQSVNAMAEKGLIQGFPNGTFKGNQNVTRYQLAMMTARMIANLEGTGTHGISKTDLQTLEKLTVEFADELALLGVKVTALEDDMQVVKEDVAGLKKDVANLKNFGGSKVKFSGDMLVRNYGAKEKIKGSDTYKAHRTESILRLQMDAQIDENVTARVRWNVIEDNLLGGNEWDGANKATGDVEVAYIKINNMFSFGGDFKFGRDWFSHGHKFVMNGYADAVSYTKRCGDVDLAINAFFADDEPHTVHNLYNINADYKYKGHSMYLGLYYFTAADDDDNGKETDIEFGFSGPLFKKDKLSYDLAAVHHKFKDNTGVDNTKGWLSHAAVKYDSKKQLKAKLAYTMADNGFYGQLNSENSVRWHDGEENIFEDLCLMSMATGGSDYLNFENLKDIKVELGYTLKNHDKHSFRLAYDHVTNKKNNRVPDSLFYLSSWTEPELFKDMKASFITLEYTYRLAANTRLRLGYQHSKTDVNYVDNKQESGQYKNNLYYTEVYAKF